MGTAQNVLNELDFAQDEEVLDDLLQKDLKVYNKQRRKYDGNTLK